MGERDGIEHSEEKGYGKTGGNNASTVLWDRRGMMHKASNQGKVPSGVLAA